MKRRESPLLDELRRRLHPAALPLRSEKIRSEASVRHFFRLHYPASTCVAMVYPQPSKEEISRICRFVRLYREQGLWVPQILDVLGDQIVLQEDVGDVLLQKQLGDSALREKRGIIEKLAEILQRLRRIDPAQTAARLDRSRMKRELDFFCEHAAGLFHRLRPWFGDMPPLLYGLVEEIGPEDTFAHRDFHTRNMLYFRRQIYLVDFQDSLVAPPLYDLVSLAFDAYCDLGSLRHPLLAAAAARGIETDRRQLLLTALQRNIKALGTFAFQVTRRGNRVYRRYIPRTVGYVLKNLQELNLGSFAPLIGFFSRLQKAYVELKK